MGDTVTNIDTHEGWRWIQGLRREIPCSLTSSQSPVSFQYSCWLNTSVCQFIGNLKCAAYREGRVPQDKNGSQGKEVRTGTGNVTVATVYYLPSAKVSAKCFILSVFLNHTNIPLR